MKHKHKIKTGNGLAGNLLLWVFTFIWFLPLAILLLNLFKSSAEISANPLALPTELNFDAMMDVLTDRRRNVLDLYFNTAVSTILGTVGTLSVSVMAAYYVARGKGKVAKFFRNYYLLGLMIPGVLTLIPNILILVHLGLFGKGFLTLFIIYTTNSISYNVFIYTSFIEGLPKELEYAAAIDGANNFQIFWKIIFPLLKPATITLLLTSSISMWNNYLTPLIYAGKMETITVGIYKALGTFRSDWATVFTYVFLAILPIVVVFIFCQKYIVEGLGGAVKE